MHMRDGEEHSSLDPLLYRSARRKGFKHKSLDAEAALLSNTN